MASDNHSERPGREQLTHRLEGELVPLEPLEQRHTQGLFVAVLGVRFTRVALRWPQVSDFLHGQIAEQAHRASTHLAMLHLPRAEDRVLALFADLGDRFGRVSPDGILIDVPLSHELIGRLTASRRPNATLALQLLHDQGHLTRLADNSWKLAFSGTAPGP